MSVPKFTKFGDNGCHIFNLELKIYHLSTQVEVKWHIVVAAYFQPFWINDMYHTPVSGLT